MTPEERELRRALEARSGEASPEFRSRLAGALAEGKPVSNFIPALAAVAAVVLVFATVGVLLLARQSRNSPPPVAATTPTASRTATASPVSSPSPQPTPVAVPVPGVLTKPPGRIDLPAGAQLSASSSHVVWALMTEQYLYRSTDRGATWQQRPLPPHFAGGFPKPEISFVSDQEGWVSPGGSPETQCNAEVIDIWHTTNGGVTWESLGTKGVSERQCKGDLSFVDSKRGFLDAFDPNNRPVIYHTIDGGLTWAAGKPLPDPPGFRSQAGGFTLQPGRVSAFGSALLVAASMQNSAGDVEFVFRSTDRGANWSYIASAKEPNDQVDFVTATHWLELIAPQQSVETTNAGASWHLSASNYSQAAPIAADFVFADSLVGYGTVRGTIQMTVDGGLHWVLIKSPGT